MFPLRDNIPSRSAPIVNYAMIAACTVVFLMQLADQADQRDDMVEKLGMIPFRVSHPGEMVIIREPVVEQTPFGLRKAVVERELAPLAFPPALTLLTCVFLHGGWLHFIGNMWFLYIFGDNVEDRLGHLGYLLMYLGCGIAASAVHLLTDRNSMIPTIGASGAIAGVMGAYMLFYPRAQVIALIPLFVFMEVIAVPAPIFLGIWFLMQFFSGTAAITSAESGGVAWWAHIGGFAAGFGVAGLLQVLHLTRSKMEPQRPSTRAFEHYRYRRGDLSP
ncbi:MAG: rhomboid family intramembrane serine protease [Planctomycetaceae bacterium]|nr:MAG: rhomboid family intramembrane serine protease [Planctomycetaceae bacterium]